MVVCVTASDKTDLSSFQLQEDCHKFSVKHFLFSQFPEMYQTLEWRSLATSYGVSVK
jgi:hypothetical protein